MRPDPDIRGGEFAGVRFHTVEIEADASVARVSPQNTRQRNPWSDRKPGYGQVDLPAARPRLLDGVAHVALSVSLVSGSNPHA
jgi:hypothetical protein